MLASDNTAIECNLVENTSPDDVISMNSGLEEVTLGEVISCFVLDDDNTSFDFSEAVGISSV